MGWWATSARMVSQSCSLYVPCGLPRLPTSLRAKHDDDDEDEDDDDDDDDDGGGGGGGDGDGDGDGVSTKKM